MFIRVKYLITVWWIRLSTNTPVYTPTNLNCLTDSSLQQSNIQRQHQFTSVRRNHFVSDNSIVILPNLSSSWYPFLVRPLLFDKFEYPITLNIWMCVLDYQPNVSLDVVLPLYLFEINSVVFNSRFSSLIAFNILSQHLMVCLPVFFCYVCVNVHKFHVDCDQIT